MSSLARARLHYLAILGVHCGGSEAEGIPAGLVVAPTLASGSISRVGPTDGAVPDVSSSVAHRPLPSEPRAPVGQSCQRNVQCRQEEDDMPTLPFPSPYEKCLPSNGKVDSNFSVQETSSRRQWDPHACCYIDWNCSKIRSMPVPGRPLRNESGDVIVASARTRKDWILDIPKTEPSEARAKEFVDAALAEHASVAAFSRVSLELMALGAPADLVREAHEAALDEIEHARMCFALASRFGAESGPGALPVPALHVPSLADVVKSAILDGFSNEAMAAQDARDRSEKETDPYVRDVLARIAEDEERHAALGLKIAKWAMSIDESVRDVIASTIDQIAPSEIAREVIIPCLRALVG